MPSDDALPPEEKEQSPADDDGSSEEQGKASGDEVIIGADGRLRQQMLDDLKAAGDSVAKLVITRSTDRKRFWGTGWMIAPQLLMTNYHVIAVEDESYNSSDEDRILHAKNAEARFGFQQESYIPYCCQGLAWENKALDYALLRLEPISQDGNISLSDWGVMQLTQGPIEFKRGDRMNIIQHPQGRPREVSIRSNYYLEPSPRENRFLYTTDTEGGSSGSPVLNDQPRVVGLHRGFYGDKKHNKDAALTYQDLGLGQAGSHKPDEKVLKVNEGILLHAILDDLKENANELYAEIAQAQAWQPPLGTLADRRKAWLARHRLTEIDPFATITGQQDSNLEKYYCPFVWTDYLRDNVRAHTPTLIVGGVGHGKSSLRAILTRQAEKSGNLVVNYETIPPSFGGQPLQLGDHLEAIFQLALAQIAGDITRWGRVPHPSPKHFEKALCADFRPIVVHYSPAEATKALLIEAFDLEELAKGIETPEEPPNEQKLLFAFTQCIVKLCGYTGTYIMVEPALGLPEQVQEAWMMLEPLFAADHLHCLPGQPFSMHFFLDTALARFAENRIKWVQTRARPVYTIAWDAQQLENLIAERLKAASGVKPSFVTRLEQLSDGFALDDLVIQASEESPRTLVRLVRDVIDIHCFPTGMPAMYIAEEEADSVLANIRQSQLSRNEFPPDDPWIKEISAGEGPRQEFKSTLRVNLRNNGQIDARMEEEVARTLCAFLNTDGGNLFIGVADDGSLVGLEPDLSKLSKKNLDGFRLTWDNIVKEYLGTKCKQYIDLDIRGSEPTIARVTVAPAKKPVFVKDDKFYMRAEASNQPMAGQEMLDYINTHWE